MAERQIGEMFAYHHTGIAVHAIAESAVFYERLGFSVTDPVFDPEQHVWLAACRKDGHLLELVAPEDDSSPCMTVLKKCGVGPYHICFECGGIDAAKETLRSNGIRFVVSSKTKPTTLFDDAEVTFLYIARIGLIELISYKNPR